MTWTEALNPGRLTSRRSNLDMISGRSIHYTTENQGPWPTESSTLSTGECGSNAHPVTVIPPTLSGSGIAGSRPMNFSPGVFMHL